MYKIFVGYIYIIFYQLFDYFSIWPMYNFETFFLLTKLLCNSRSNISHLTISNVDIRISLRNSLYICTFFYVTLRKVLVTQCCLNLYVDCLAANTTNNQLLYSFPFLLRVIISHTQLIGCWTNALLQLSNWYADTTNIASVTLNSWF